jgi:hypothetical protein
MRRRLSYANIASTLAIFLAMGGTAWAAHHWLITSTSQIKPSVLDELRSPRLSLAPRVRPVRQDPQVRLDRMAPRD